MITSFLLGVLNFFWYGLVELIWPQSIAGFNLNTISEAVSSLSSAVMPLLRLGNVVFPLDVLFAGIGIFLALYISFFLFKITRFLINVLRGSGA